MCKILPLKSQHSSFLDWMGPIFEIFNLASGRCTTQRKRCIKMNLFFVKSIKSLCPVKKKKPGETAGSIPTNECIPCHSVTAPPTPHQTAKSPGPLPAWWMISLPRQPIPQFICTYVSNKNGANFPKLWQFGSAEDPFVSLMCLWENEQIDEIKEVATFLF